MDYKRVIDDYHKLIIRAIEINRIINKRVDDFINTFHIDYPLNFFPYEFNFDLNECDAEDIVAKVSYDEDKIRFYAETMNGSSYRLTVPASYLNMSDNEIIKDADHIIASEIQDHLDIAKAEEDYKTYLELKKRFEGNDKYFYERKLL